MREALAAIVAWSTDDNARQLAEKLAQATHWIGEHGGPTEMTANESNAILGLIERQVHLEPPPDSEGVIDLTGMIAVGDQIPDFLASLTEMPPGRGGTADPTPSPLHIPPEAVACTTVRLDQEYPDSRSVFLELVLHLAKDGKDLPWTQSIRQAGDNKATCHLLVHGIVFNFVMPTVPRIDLFLIATEATLALPSATALHLEPTPETFDSGKFLVRAWNGFTATGESAVALIALVSTPSKMPNLTPAPRLYEGASETFLGYAAEIWEGVARINEQEIAHLASLARAYAAYRDPTCKPKQCLFCHATFQGPAVYCCLDCATVDAI